MPLEKQQRASERGKPKQKQDSQHTSTRVGLALYARLNTLAFGFGLNEDAFTFSRFAVVGDIGGAADVAAVEAIEAWLDPLVPVVTVGGGRDGLPLNGGIV